MVRNFAEEFGYQDVYLVDSENGDIVYSLRKRIDFGTSHGWTVRGKPSRRNL